MATDGNGKVQSPNVVEGKKRKRIKEKDEVSDIELASLGEGLVAPLEISKLKKKTKSSVESKNFGPESKALSNKANGNNHPKLCYSRLISDLEDSNSESEVGDDGRRISDKMDAAKRGTSKVPSLPPPCPKSPPEYPNLYGKHQELAKVQMLEREIGFLEVPVGRNRLIAQAIAVI